MKVVKRLSISLLTLALIALGLKSFDHALANDGRKTNATLSSKSINKASDDNSASLIASINNMISNNPDGLEAAVSLIDLNSNKEYGAGQTTALFKAASTAKVLAAIDYLHEVEAGQASLSQDIDGTNAQQLIKQMIEVSDDNAWADIDNYLGDQQQSYASEIGLSSFTGGEYNTMTAADMARLLSMLYQGKLLNRTDQALLLNYMSNTTSTNLIQAVLPTGITAYHKYGQVWGYLNDAAIVDYQKHPYILVVFTNDQDGTTDDYNDQVDLIQSISRLVFQSIINNQA